MEKKHLSGFYRVFLLVLFLSFTACGKSADNWVLPSNTAKTVAETTHLKKLTIEKNAVLAAPEGYRLTLTVNGVETGQMLKTWAGVDYTFAPGAYEGDIVLTVSKANDVAWTGPGGDAGGPPENETPSAPSGFDAGMPDAYPFRQALYLDTNGIDEAKSVQAAVQGEKPAGFQFQNIKIVSKGTFYESPSSPGGTGFNGIYAAGGKYDIKNLEIDFTGDGRSDFVGFGSAVVAAGKDTRLVLDNAVIHTQGVVRSAVIAKEGSSVLVKNSRIQVKNGVLPPGYKNTMNISQMRSTLWISGMTGTTRATSLLGTGTRATYIDSTISFEGWGGLSTDIGNGAKLTVINCKINNIGNTGYGHYNNCSAVTRILGSEFNVGSVGSAGDSGSVYFGDSTREAVSALNDELELGLTAEELKAIPEKPTIINSKDQGVLWHGSGSSLTITGGTTINTEETLFVDKGAYTDINVDGSGGVQLTPGNGIIMQVMDDDEPSLEPKTNNFGVYEEPTGPVVKDDSHDITNATETDALAKFSNIELKGDFYNAARGGRKKNSMTGKMGSVSRNLGLSFDGAVITGIISASDARHYYNGKYYPKIGKAESKVFSHVVNTPGPAVNNGVIVTLKNASKWTVTGTSYLTKLSLDESSSIIPAGEDTDVSMTVNGVKTNIAPGNTYTGAIVVSVE